MRFVSRVALLGALAAVAAAGPASAAPSFTMKVSPNKRGTLTLGAPTSFTASFASPERTSTTDGSIRLKAIAAKLPDQLVFNPIPFKLCNVASFVATQTCPSATKLGDATIKADGGPEVGEITATTTLYLGTGYSVLANVKASRPAVINESVIGSLQSSATETDSSVGFGLQMYIPVTPKIQMPIDGVFPTVKAFNATIKPPTKSVSVPGVKGKYKMPVAGLGPCKTLNFALAVTYTNASGVDTVATDSDTDKQKCKK
ncbi:MAG: hypothetical protein J7513_10565 [Solirubrobacteraceae bacterium]|nr:hypothetical protein [Solirubrobacteraceae bacterium]